MLSRKAIRELGGHLNIGSRTDSGCIVTANPDEEVLQEFLDDPDYMHGIAEELRRAIADQSIVEQLVVPIDEEDDEAHEGRLLQRRHFVRERDRNLRRKKISDFLKKHPCVYCEVCGFDFEAVYGEPGREFIEVHHTLPLHASGERKTKPKDLILLCANCHRMIHRSAPWLMPNDLRELLSTQAAVMN